MSTPLCIIDMQPHFHETADRALPGTLREIRKARERHAPIIIVEYADLGPSYPEIYDQIGDYPNGLVFVEKENDGGGYEMINAAEAHGIDLNQKMIVCGVNRSFCVFETLYELRHELDTFEVEVPLDATWCEWPDEGEQRLGGLGCILVGS